MLAQGRTVWLHNDTYRSISQGGEDAIARSILDLDDSADAGVMNTLVHDAVR